MKDDDLLVRIQSYYLKNTDYIESALNKSKYCFTAKALLRFYKKYQSIYHLISNIDTEKDSYCAFILMRCHIEHFIVFIYIWMKRMLDENDDTGNAYYESYLIQEFLRRVNTSNKYNTPLNTEAEKMFARVYKTLTTNSNFIKRGNEKLYAKKKQFELRNISTFVEQNLGKNATRFLKLERIHKLIAFYDTLSSFIHGGPTSELMIFEQSRKEIKKVVEEMKSQLLQLNGVYKFHILYFLAYENRKIERDFKNMIERIV